jgi:hypothetical protein
LAYRASEKYKEGKSVIEKFYIERVEYAELRQAKVQKATSIISKSEISLGMMVGGDLNENGY